ncbi:hypothetical protein GCM10010275_35110 [Streptomyces litmocidini]|nr:hypothetical protein GCM10010275_35110 [Streptomyces litmocidini]
METVEGLAAAAFSGGEEPEEDHGDAAVPAGPAAAQAAGPGAAKAFEALDRTDRHPVVLGLRQPAPRGPGRHGWSGRWRRREGRGGKPGGRPAGQAAGLAAPGAGRRRR